MVIKTMLIRTYGHVRTNGHSWSKGNFGTSFLLRLLESGADAGASTKKMLKIQRKNLQVKEKVLSYLLLKIYQYLTILHSKIVDFTEQKCVTYRQITK